MQLHKVRKQIHTAGEGGPWGGGRGGGVVTYQRLILYRHVHGPQSRGSAHDVHIAKTWEKEWTAIVIDNIVSRLID